MARNADLFFFFLSSWHIQGLSTTLDRNKAEIGIFKASGELTPDNCSRQAVRTRILTFSWCPVPVASPRVR
jgi:hypothetical protein